MYRRVDALARAGLTEDAWGSDDEDDTSAARLSSTTQHTPPLRTSTRTLAPTPSVSYPPAPPANLPLLPSLQALCLGCLGRHVTEVVEALGDNIRYVYPDARASLLSVARRTERLTRKLLLALVDESWHQLDLSGCNNLSDAALIAALQRLPRLQAADLSGCNFRADSFRVLAKHCPQLEVLRLGGGKGQDDSFEGALEELLPEWKVGGGGQRGQAKAEQDEQESWESLVEDIPSTKTPSAQPGRLKNLRLLLWPTISHSAMDLVTTRCPRIAVNPPLSKHSAGKQRTSHQCAGSLMSSPVGSNVGLGSNAGQTYLAEDLSVPLDEPLAMAVGPEAWRDLQQTAEKGGGEVMHIAQKFRMAYVERAHRIRAHEQRLWKQQEKREFRSSKALREVDRWLDAE